MKLQLWNNCFLYTYLLLAGLVFVYLLLRACYIPPVHDEASTFFHYINHGEFIPGQALFDANNHILNSFLSSYFVKIFGVNTLSIRLANLLLFPVYAYFLFLFTHKVEHALLKVVLVLTGLGMHGFIEYFAYSRGYGMSMAFLMAGLYFAYKFVSENRVFLFIPAFVMFWMATLCNLTIQNSTLLFIAYATLYILMGDFTKRQRISGLILLFFATLAMIPFIKLSLAMKARGLLYYAQGEDFWTAVVVSFTRMYFGIEGGLLTIFWVIWFGIFLFLLFSLVFKYRTSLISQKATLLFPFMLLGNLLGILFMHAFLNVNYPSDRTGMYLILYLILSCVFLADKSGKYLRLSVGLPTVVLLVQFIMGFNFTHSTYWRGERIPESFYNRIYDETMSGKFHSNPTVGGYQIKNLVWAWYNFKNTGALQNLRHSNYYNGFEDYQLFSGHDFDRLNYDSLDVDIVSGNILARRKTFLKLEPFLDSLVFASEFNYSEEYLNFFECLDTDTFLNKSWLMELEIKLYSLQTPPRLSLVSSFHDANGNTLDYQTSPLNWLKKEFRPEHNSITLKMWWYHVPPETKRIVVYLWNVKKEIYTVSSARLRISKVINPPLF